MGINGASDEKQRGGGWLWIGAVVAGAVGVLLILVGSWAAHLYTRFTPIYTDVSCKYRSAKLDGVSFNPDLTIALRIEVMCNNPNPYSIRIASARPGKVYVGSDQSAEVSSVHIPASLLPAKSTGSVDARSTIVVTGTSVFNLLPFLGKEVPIQMELDFDVVIDVSFFFGSWKVSKALDADCGMRLSGLGGLIMSPLGSRMGPMVCADSFDDLAIPAVGADPASGGAMSFSAVALAPEEIEEGKRAKNAGLGATMGVAFSLGLLLLALSACCACRAHGSRGKPDPGTPPEATVLGTRPNSGAEANPQTEV